MLPLPIPLARVYQFRDTRIGKSLPSTGKSISRLKQRKMFKPWIGPPYE